MKTRTATAKKIATAKKAATAKKIATVVPFPARTADNKVPGAKPATTPEAKPAAKAAAPAPKVEKPVEAKPQPKAKAARPGSKAAKVVAMLLRKQGASRPEIAKALNWADGMRRTTLQRMMAGKVKLREDKEGRCFGSPL